MANYSDIFPVSTGGGGSTTDPYSANVLLLARFNNTGVTDLTGRHTFTTYGGTINKGLCPCYNMSFGNANMPVQVNGNLSDFDFTTSAWTIEFYTCFFNTRGVSAANWFFSKNNSSGNTDIASSWYQNNLTLASGGTVSFTPTLNQWYYMAYVKSSGSVKFYIDGTLMATNNSPSNTYNSDYVFYIGNDKRNYTGETGLAEFRVSNIARTITSRQISPFPYT